MTTMLLPSPSVGADDDDDDSINNVSRIIEAVDDDNDNDEGKWEKETSDEESIQIDGGNTTILVK